jgi:hypothetical protein
MSFGCLFSSSASRSTLLLPGISLRVSLADNCSWLSSTCDAHAKAIATRHLHVVESSDDGGSHGEIITILDISSIHYSSVLSCWCNKRICRG